jgi:hypothetical protein
MIVYYISPDNKTTDITAFKPVNPPFPSPILHREERGDEGVDVDAKRSSAFSPAQQSSASIARRVL